MPRGTHIDVRPTVCDPALLIHLECRPLLKTGFSGLCTHVSCQGGGPGPRPRSTVCVTAYHGRETGIAGLVGVRVSGLGCCNIVGFEGARVCTADRSDVGCSCLKFIVQNRRGH